MRLILTVAAFSTLGVPNLAMAQVPASHGAGQPTTASGHASPGPSQPPNYITPPLFAGIKTTNEYSIGVMRGQAQEYVYNPNGSTLSRLNWNFDNVSMFNSRTTVHLTPWLAIGFRGAMNLTGDATMRDEDYGLVGCPAAGTSTYCESNHTARLRRAHMLDASIAARLYESAGFALRVVGGFQHDHYRWEAIGGTANYGVLPPGHVITYSQTWQAAYLGAALDYTRGAWTLNGRLVGSPWATAANRDLHHVRSTLFHDTAKGANFISGELGLAYRFNPFFSLKADYRFQQWGLGKGPMTERSLADRTTNHYTYDAAGAANTSHMLSLGFKVDLQPNSDTAATSTKDTHAEQARPAVWRGWYMGINTGATVQRDRWQTESIGTPARAPTAESASIDISGGSNPRATLFGGYNARTIIGMMGLEFDIGRSTMSVTQSGIPGTGTAAQVRNASDAININHELDGSVRLRYGSALTDSILAYVTGGVAFEQLSVSASCTPGYSGCGGAALYSQHAHWRAGWTAGAGAELNLARNWFARSEYRYTDFGAYHGTFFRGDRDLAMPVRIDGTSHRLDVGLGTRF
jgi:outer membrane immunogenic protein